MPELHLLRLPKRKGKPTGPTGYRGHQIVTPHSLARHEETGLLAPTLPDLPILHYLQMSASGVSESGVDRPKHETSTVTTM